MANKNLTGHTFKLPDDLIQYLGSVFNNYKNNTDTPGYERMKFLLDNQQCTYEQLKRIKHDLEQYPSKEHDTPAFLLNGGKPLYKWVNEILSSARDNISIGKSVKADTGMSNIYRKDNDTKLADVSFDNIKQAPEILSTDNLKEEITKIKRLIFY
jgi:hypothetical protein